MSAERIDGKAIAADVRSDVARAVETFSAEHDYIPTLAVVLVGEDPASQVYVKSKHKFTREAGMYSREHKLPIDTDENSFGSALSAA